MSYRRRTTDDVRHRWGPVFAYLGIAGILAFIAHEQRAAIDVTRALAARTACETLEHRIGSRLTGRSVLKATKASGTLLADLIERSLKVENQAETPDEARRRERIAKIVAQERRKVDRVVIPPSPEPELVAERNRVCLRVGIDPDSDPRLEGD